MRILIIEDDKELTDAVALHLKKEGYSVDVCHDGNDADYYLSQIVYDAVLLDRMLPGKDGIQILRQIREQGMTVPVMMVTALGGLDDRIDGLDEGADDYITKPFAAQELSARLRALLRRPRDIKNINQEIFGNTTLDISGMQIKTEMGHTTLSKKETELLEYFFKNPEQILERDQILNRVWGTDAFVESGSVDTYIHFIRRRLKSVQSDIKIKNVHGVGYRAEAGEEYD